MEQGLKLILKEIPWFLVAKGIVIGLVWFYLPWWLWLIVFLFFVFRTSGDPVISYGNTVLVVILLSFNLGWLPEWLSFVLALFLAVISGLLIGLRDLFFVRKVYVYRIINTLVLALVLTAFFWLVFFDKLAIYSYLWLVVILYLLFSDLARVVTGKQLRRLWGGVAAFIMMQIVYILSFLPIEFINKASIALLCGVMIQEILVQGERGKKANSYFYLIMGSVFTLLFLIILAVASWEVV